ncbi:hypothetical protein caldi_13560 [Caldinitratiruptor microaerophilus]|uniref:Replication initiation factor n=1 Tax=Caldinitratiruptor microaerophilus TaxID=671077 RepID=A0AA35CMU9_9FIRM|nr:hypothetical protein caldi_13560 [Caldinitratiruptor microaerophilus]
MQLGELNERRAAERRGMTLEEYRGWKQERQERRLRWQGVGQLSRERAAARRGITLDEYMRLCEEAERRRKERASERQAQRERRERLTALLAEQRRRMTYPGEGTDLGDGVRLLHVAVDSLAVTVYGEVPAPLVERWLNLKQEAREADAPQESGLVFRGNHLLVQPWGWRSYAIWLQSPDLSVMVTNRTGYPPLYIQLRASYLYTVGPAKAWEEVAAWIDTWIMRNSARVSRIDLCADLQGWDLSETPLTHFLTMAKIRERRPDLVLDDGRVIYFGNRTFTLYFGRRSSPIMARIYDKTAEVVATGKTWLYNYWSGWDGQSRVVRVEYTMGREWLEAFDLAEAEPADVLEAVGDLWREAMAWLTLRRPTSDPNKSRWPLAEWWVRLAGAGWADCRQGLVRGARFRVMDAEAEALAPGLLGYLTSVAVRKGYRIPQRGAGRSVMAIAAEVLRDYMRRKSETWEDAIRRKAQRSNIVRRD